MRARHLRRGPHVETADMVAAGVTPQVMVALYQERRRVLAHGRRRAGKSADFTVLDGNPLDEITNTRRISAAYLRGAAVDRARAP